jgi:hypothetical protein
MLKERTLMKLLRGCLALALAFAACGGGRDDNKPAANTSTTNTQTTTTTQTETANAATPSPTATASPATVSGERPVEFTYLGVTPDKDSVAYKIKINSAKPVSQIDLNMKYMDDKGGVVEETTYAWQNVVKSKKNPIERGRTYEVKDPLPEGATRAEVTLKRVHFGDGTVWNE